MSKATESSINRGVTATRYSAITPSDSTALPDGPCVAIYVGGAGDMVVVDADGTATTFTGVLAGCVYPIRAVRINSTSTTATNLVALY